MKVTLFCHSLVSDWNHGNAHFLRGIARELVRRGHDVNVLEPADGWSRHNLLADPEGGEAALAGFHAAYPELGSRTYDPQQIDLDAELDGSDVVLVHDWIEPGLVGTLGERRRRRNDHVLLFYDAHHRAASTPEAIRGLDLSGYDAVLAFGRVLRDLYRRRGWHRRVEVWHEAADTSLFHPRPELTHEGDVVWIGNWGDGERSEELHRFLLRPSGDLRLSGSVYGVRYPSAAHKALAAAGLRYRGWLPNFRAPEAFARHRLTVHVPRRAYVRELPGIPTIRVFEALACGIPLICAHWEDREGLFRPGQDYLMASDGEEMRVHMKRLLGDPEAAAAQAAHGLERVRARHTCAHRVDELLALVDGLVVR